MPLPLLLLLLLLPLSGIFEPEGPRTGINTWLQLVPWLEHNETTRACKLVGLGRKEDYLLRNKASRARANFEVAESV